MQRVAAVIGGASLSYYGGEYVAAMTSAHVGFVSWMLGMFGMAVAHRIFDLIATIEIGRRLDKLLERIGL